MFHGVHFNHDSQNSFSVHHDSRTPKVVDHGVTKIPLPISPLPPPPPSTSNREPTVNIIYVYQIAIYLLDKNNM